MAYARFAARRLRPGLHRLAALLPVLTFLPLPPLVFRALHPRPTRHLHLLLPRLGRRVPAPAPRLRPGPAPPVPPAAGLHLRCHAPSHTAGPQGGRGGRGAPEPRARRVRRHGREPLPGKKIDAPALHRLSLVFTIY
ncbi:hypothetical protein PVAP13_2KG478505 [Panicum virgatum]|uniref:Uncharacterized protein n=1 Tax=Panicum virgatum TaxID=38727 RepID=A0A8T0WFJ2_PANVG|nr:hypothetical protein PVAP13_2KG478505 [Panicum virgatum]